MSVRPLPNLEAYRRPASVDEALGLLESPGARPLGGGTVLALSRHPGVKVLVDLKGLGLDFVRAEAGGVRIGGTAKVQRLARSAEVEAVAGGIVAAAARTYLTRPHRNAATLGGVLLAASGWSDIAAALRATGGTVRIAERGGIRDLPVDAFFEASPAKAVGKGFVESVFLPGGGRGGYARLARTETDVSVVAVAVRLDGTVARIALTGVVGAPVRARAAEAAVADGPVAAAAKALEGIEPLGDIRGSAAYRAKVIPVLVRRALEGVR